MQTNITPISHDEVLRIIDAQRIYFSSGAARPVNYRRSQLKKLKESLQRSEDRLLEALFLDLGKSREEAFLTEFLPLYREIDYHLSRVKRWARPRTAHTPLILFPSRSYVEPLPLGCVLIFSPWNYPLQLLLTPLIGAISAGCCALLRPSPSTPLFSSLISDLIRETFCPEYVAVVEGGIGVNQWVLEERFDLIFFTGSTRVGKIVAQAVARHLTPTILELGGKSPCIVSRGADLRITARRIIWGKLINAGQTCVAPDYLFVHESKREALIHELIGQIEVMYGPDPISAPHYPRIISSEAMDRLVPLLKEGRIRYGGKVDLDRQMIGPTLIDEVSPEMRIMQEEIFGPILPILTYRSIDQVLSYVNGGDRPLALYFFGIEEEGRRVACEIVSGGCCINDMVIHVANHHLPFGGVGKSGSGNYHGRASFDAFSHHRSTMIGRFAFDFPLRYPPFPFFRWIKKIFG